MSLTALPPAPARTPASPAPRDRFVDLLRVFGMVLVVAQHWTMPVLALAGGRLTTGNALAGVPLITWISQVMPLVFFAGGAANAMSLRSASSPGLWAARRLRRLAWPVVPLAAVWVPLPYVLEGLGLPSQPVEVAARTVGQLLWFLAVYLVAVVSTPWLVRARASRVLPLLAAGAVLTDVVRFSGVEAAGYLNVVFVWLAVHQVGFRYAEGRLAWLSGARAAGLAVAGFGMVAALVVAGPYPASMIGMPGMVSNMAPPSACLLPLFAGQLGLAMLLRPALVSLARRPRVEAALAVLAPRMMTLYLWHMTALVTVAGVAMFGFGLVTPAVGSFSWWSRVPLWLAALVIVLLALTGLFARFEEPPGPASAGRVVAAAVLIGGALTTLTATGFAPGVAPVAAALALAAGLRLTSGSGAAGHRSPRSASSRIS
ncbi:acyltransferase family protein [Microbispora sp. ATCC PTA-5024]|uniref:acyltransferase family protein n=1 Tax=Microbispora sp. ATCC PTA-5024 TaxID=316330 RepID=UPI0003DD1858|nr:acyltransferase [Microbispora sp. ATCC PTA-5024]ETK36063.1 acyltransferase [Microbispora sp. ATCC PTA-5024]